MKKVGLSSQALLVLVALLAAGCSTPASQQPATPAPAQQGTAPTAAPQPAETSGRAGIFIYAHPTAFPDLDPAISFSNDSAVLSNCYETLTFYNPPGSEEILSPHLATRWESSADATEWVFYLRQGVTFHDGEPFNAEAVKYSIENTLEVGIGAAYIWDPVEEIEVIDEYALRFKLSYPAPLDLVASSGYGAWIYSPKAYQEKGSDWFQQGHCVGTGPYIIEGYEPGSRLVMTRNEQYWGGWKPGQFEKVVFEISQDPVVLQQKIEAGTADFTYEIPPDNVENIEKTRTDIVVHTDPSFQNLVGLLNTQKPPLDDVKVRHALAYSFPYQQFIQAVMGERATQARGVVPVGMWGHGEDLFQYSYDLEKAKQLLAEAGHPTGGFKLTMTYSAGDLDEQQLGEVWKAELAKLGIELEVRGMNWDAQWALSKSDPQKAQDVFVMYWWPDYVSPYSFLRGLFYTEEEILFNLCYYSNPEYDELIEEANKVAGTDREEAAEMFIDAQKILLEDVPSLFFYDVSNTHLIRADVKGYVANPAYPHVVFVYHLSRQP